MSRHGLPRHWSYFQFKEHFYENDAIPFLHRSSVTYAGNLLNLMLSVVYNSAAVRVAVHPVYDGIVKGFCVLLIAS